MVADFFTCGFGFWVLAGTGCRNAVLVTPATGRPAAGLAGAVATLVFACGTAVVAVVAVVAGTAAGAAAAGTTAAFATPGVHGAAALAVVAVGAVAAFFL